MASGARGGARVQSNPALQGKRVIICDDQPTTRLALRSICQVPSETSTTKAPSATTLGISSPRARGRPVFLAFTGRLGARIPVLLMLDDELRRSAMLTTIAAGRVFGFGQAEEDHAAPRADRCRTGRASLSFSRVNRADGIRSASFLAVPLRAPPRA